MSGIDDAKPWLFARASADGHDEALRFEGRSWTWAELAGESELLASRLSSAGVVRGDLVAVRMAPGPRMVALLHALQALGAAMLPLNLRLTAAETSRILAHARPRLLVDDGNSAAVDGVPVLHPLDDSASTRRSFAMPTRIDPQAALTVVYTSGTTSAPKGVVLTNANHAAAAAASRARLGHGREDTWLATLPLFHVGGLAILTRSVLEGSSVALEAGFDLGRTVDALQRGTATMVSLVPTMLARVLDAMANSGSEVRNSGGAVSPRVRAVLVGGAALSPSLGRLALDAGLPVATTWGMTEACSQICTSVPGSEAAALGCVGRPLPGIEVAVEAADEHGFGQLRVHGANVMRGYLRNAEADRGALEDGWLHSGDVGRIDADGSVWLAGRRDDLIVTGGENVAPVEVEHVLDDHPDVVESLVLGEEDAEWGQKVVALVVSPAGVPATELTKWCRQRLAGYKVPREFRFVDALERGPTGKVLRRAPARSAGTSGA